MKFYFINNLCFQYVFQNISSGPSTSCDHGNSDIVVASSNTDVLKIYRNEYQIDNNGKTGSDIEAT